MLTLPSLPSLFSAELRALAAQFACPLEDVLAYAEMIGMDIGEDMEFLWLADEALCAPEPAGWEERQDPRGDSYYFNETTGMAMAQNPVDYHYQQLYLQLKLQRHKLDPDYALSESSWSQGHSLGAQSPRDAFSAALKGPATPSSNPTGGNMPKLDLGGLSSGSSQAINHPTNKRPGL